MKRKQSLLLLLIFLGFRVEAATYTVKAGGGGSFTTIQACATAAAAGDTCDVYSGSYGGWTQSANGSSGNPITFQVHTGETVTITSAITLSNRSRITIKGFRIATSGTAITANSATFIIVDSNNFQGVDTAFSVSDTSPGSDNTFSNNIIVGIGSGSSSGLYLYGDRDRIESNDISRTADFIEMGGANCVVRNNKWHDVNAGGQGTAEHIDGIQIIGGGTTPTLSFSLVEGNVEKNCLNDGGNCHFMIIRTGSGPVADTIIFRYNYAQNLDGSGVSVGGIGDNVPNFHFYNNTIATETKIGENGDGISFQNAANGVVLNNIFYNVEADGWSPTIGNAVGNGNIAFNSGYSGTWNSPYSSEATYNTLRNKDPLFANYPTDGTLRATSPAKGAAVALTTVGGGDSRSGTSLVVSDSRFFQPGWAGTQADWIRVGASNTVQIASINYSTNTITLANAISRSPGDPVYLYKDSSGRQVLIGSAPDIGAYPYTQVGGPAPGPAPPTGLTAVVQ